MLPQRHATAVKGSFFLHSAWPHERPFENGLDGLPLAGEVAKGEVPKEPEAGLVPEAGAFWLAGAACEGEVEFKAAEESTRTDGALAPVAGRIEIGAEAVGGAWPWSFGFTTVL